MAKTNDLCGGTRGEGQDKPEKGREKKWYKTLALDGVVVVVIVIHVGETPLIESNKTNTHTHTHGETHTKRTIRKVAW